MRSIARLFGAFGTLADSLLSLAGVIDSAADKLRQQLGIDGEAAPIVLDHQAGDNAERVGTNGAAKGRKSRAGA